MFGTLVSPARKLSHWLTFRQKFLVIFLLALLPSLVLLALNLLDRYQDIKRDSAEIAGMHYIAKIGPATKALRDHRGMHALIAGGYAQAANDDERISKEIDAALDTLDREAANFPEAAAQWRSKLATIRNDWNALKQNWSGMSIADSFARHSALILALNEFCHHVAGDTGLLLDPDASAYYLMAIQIDDLPALNEILGKIRGQMAQLKADDPRLLHTLTYSDYQLNNALLAQIQRIDNNIELLGDEYPSDRQAIEGDWVAVKSVIAALRTDFNAILAKESFSEPSQRQAIFARVSAIFDNTAAFQKLLQKQLQEEKLVKRYQTEVHSISVTAGVGLAVLCLVAWLIAGFAQDLTQRVDLLNQGMRRIGQGDLRQPISLTGRDEMVVLAQSINTLLDQLSQSLSTVKRSAHELLDTSNDIASASQQVAQSTFAQSNAASSMAASIEELTVSINHMADNARQAHAQSDDSGRASQDGSVIIGQAVESIMAIAASVRASAGSVQALGEDARAISGIAGVIKEIADQTNLLALNAAIESARAGETGRGFAVVADEVRKLAERTTTCTAQISQMISRIQQGTDSVVDAMRQGVAKVEHGMALANQAGTAIARIRAGSVDTAGAVNEISVALNQQSATAQTVAAKVETIAQMSEQNNRAAETSAATAEQLRSLALTLEERMAVFQIAA